MSRQSEAKKARRRKRRASQEAAWIPEPIYAELVDSAGESDAITEAVADIDEWISGRGWLLDTENAADLLSWVYPPSAAEFDDENLEPVTRIWITVDEDDDEVVLEFGGVLVGSGEDDDAYLLDPDRLADHVAALEAYRPGLPRPELD